LNQPKGLASLRRSDALPHTHVREKPRRCRAGLRRMSSQTFFCAGSRVVSSLYGRRNPRGSLPLATLLSAALLSRLVTAIGILILLAGGVLAALLAALTLIVLAALLTALMLATLVLLILILVHRCLSFGFPVRIE
jgi:hypothetical protein